MTGLEAEQETSKHWLAALFGLSHVYILSVIALALIGAQLSVVVGGVATIVFVGIMAFLIPALRKYQATR
ncbi:MAG TPA: hypothetical protein VED37_14935 [Ktedonobacteraceae bacterium]|nr:hypothetical protein [Ktedonobacteraceae bacterium]